MTETSRRLAVLLAENDSSLRDLVHRHLAAAGFDVTFVVDGSRVLAVTALTRFDLIVLSATLPGLDGITLCRSLRTNGANTSTPVLMLTSQDSESDRVLGFESGADDFMTRPFGTRELVARAAALVRRSHRSEGGNGTPAGVVRSREITLDADRRRVEVRGQVVELTRQEFDLLYLMAARPGVVFSRAALMARVWNGDTHITDRTIDSVVSRLRKKIEQDAHDPSLILTSWGVGYKFVDAE